MRLSLPHAQYVFSPEARVRFRWLQAENLHHPYWGVCSRLPLHRQQSGQGRGSGDHTQEEEIAYQGKQSRL